MSNPIQNRYDFILLFDVKDGNPNGDPDAGNLPRVDPETGHGLVTDVCLKRKVRNYVQLIKANESGYDIYVKEKAVLGRAHVKAFNELGIKLGEETRVEISKELNDKMEELGLPEGLSTVEEDGKYFLVSAPDMDKKAVQAWLKESKPEKTLKDTISNTLKLAKSRKPTGEEVEKGREKMCGTYYDIRTFGAVMSLKSAPNCGQVRGPVQLTFARSISQVVPLEHSITRMAVATEAEAEKQQGDNRTMGRKFTIPYGLYLCHGFISASLAAQTLFTDDDLTLLKTAFKNMFDVDRSAARGEMSLPYPVIAFKHESVLGNAPAHELFARLKVIQNDPTHPARNFSDYTVSLDKENLPKGVSIELW
jgi:CRISPR-associated protein Csd2